MPQLPKFNQKLKESVLQPQLEQAAQPGYGIILDYNVRANTATVLMSNRGSEDLGEIYEQVPCPVQMGVQSMAPEPGRPCWISFKDNSFQFPVITHFFNHVYETVDYPRQYEAVNSVPRFMYGL